MLRALILSGILSLPLAALSVDELKGKVWLVDPEAMWREMDADPVVKRMTPEQKLKLRSQMAGNLVGMRLIFSPEGIAVRGPMGQLSMASLKSWESTGPTTAIAVTEQEKRERTGRIELVDPKTLRMVQTDAERSMTMILHPLPDGSPPNPFDK